MEIIEKKVGLKDIPKCGGLLCRGDDPARYIVFAKDNVSDKIYKIITCPHLKCQTTKEVKNPKALTPLLP